MGFNLKGVRDFASGVIDEAALEATTDTDLDDIEEDEEFIQECMALVVPTVIQTELIGESACAALDEAAVECMQRLADFYVGQGMLSEAAAVSITNPKVNFVRLNKEAQIKRLSKILTLKMARRDNQKSYKKYKIGQHLKKTNMAEMVKRYGTKADQLAKKLWAKTHKGNKLKATVSSKKETIKAKK